MYKNIPFKIIAAIDSQHGIGYQDDLLYRSKEDMQHFRSMTIYDVVIMGRKTYESLGCIPLKDRINIVITSSADTIYDEHEPLDSVIFAKDFDEAMKKANIFRHRKHNQKLRSIFVIGGGNVYHQAIKYADELIITKFRKAAVHVDTYFPIIKSEEFDMVSSKFLAMGVICNTYLRIKQPKD